MKTETKWFLAVVVGTFLLWAPFMAMRLGYIPLATANNIGDLNQVIYPGVLSTILGVVGIIRSILDKNNN